MPTRPSTHQLEDQSRIAFRSHLPIGWVFRDKTPDYGIDGEVELFDEKDKATGDQFLVQLKAVEQLRKEAPSISLEIEWINYYLALELPVIVALWVKDSNEIFWIWAGEIDLYYAKPNAKSFTVRLSNKWEPETPQTIQRHLELRRRLKLRQVPAPLRVAVSTTDRARLRSHLQTLFAQAPRALCYSETEADVTCALAKEELRIFFSGLPGTVFHSMRTIDDEGTAKRIVIGTAITLANYGALNQAAELWSLVSGLDGAISSLDVGWSMVSLLARAGAHTELVVLIRALSPRFGKAAIAAPLVSLYWHAPQHRRTELGKLLVELELENLRDPSPEARSIASYNLAKLSNDRKKEVGHFARAVRDSTFYFDKSYFWTEFGATLFTYGRYQAALCCYRHAYETLGHSERRSHYGDALMHTGRYSEALEVFRGIVSTGKGEAALSVDSADAFIKMKLLELIVQEFGISTQERQGRLAAAALGQYERSGTEDAEMLARTDAALRQDALYNVAWFNRAFSLKRSGKEIDALLCYLAAAAVKTSDDESWLNAMLLAQRYRPDLMLSLLVFVAHLRGEEFVRFLNQTAQRQANEVGRKLFLDLAQIFSENLPSPEGGVVRIHRGKGAPLILKSSAQDQETQRTRKEQKPRQMKKQRRKSRAGNKKGGRKK